MEFGKETDRSTLIRVIEGHATAFRLVYDTCSTQLYNFAYRFLKNKELSKEIVPETRYTLPNDPDLYYLQTEYTNKYRQVIKNKNSLLIPI